MANAGENTERIDGWKVTLTNSTDTLDFGQMFVTRYRGMVRGIKKARGDGTRTRLDRTGERSITGQIWLTIPEITTFIGYNTPTGTPPQLTPKNWDIGFTGMDETTDTIRISGVVELFEFEAPEKDGTWCVVGIDSVDGVVSEP
jgi:hypothetical protein